MIELTQNRPRDFLNFLSIERGSSASARRDTHK
jgi:hypothetical protein